MASKTQVADPLAEVALNLHDARTSERKKVFDPIWQDLANYCLPQSSDIQVEKTEGVVGWTDEIYDSTAIQSNLTCAAGHRNWCTPSNEKWLAFLPPDLLPDKDAAAPWYANCTDIALAALLQSNFYTTIHEYYLERGGFGTGAIIAEPGKRTSLSFYKLQAGTYCIQEDDEYFVDTLSRDLLLSARQAVLKFGLQNVSDKVAKAYEATDRKSMDRQFKFVHEIRPRDPEERDFRKKDPENMPYSSLYVDVEARQVVRNSGYEEQPFMVSRFLRWGKTPYGFSPMVVALPNVRELNFVVRFMDALAELRANPRLLIPQSLKGDVDLRAGGITTFDENNPNGKPQEWMTEGDFDIGEKLVLMKQQAVKEAFFVDLFNMMAQYQDKRMTAEEVRARMSEKLEQFSPAFDRLTTELLNPLLRRVFGLLWRGGHFPPPPAAVMVAAGPRMQSPALPQIQYTSRIALQLRSMRNRAFMETMQVIGQIGQQRPEVYDNFDIDKGVRGYAIDQGLNPDLVRPMEGRGGVIDIRKERLKQQQQAQALEAAQAAAKAGKDLGKAPKQIQDRMMAGMPGGN
jgi:hypothetical protein